MSDNIMSEYPFLLLELYSTLTITVKVHSDAAVVVRFDNGGPFNRQASKWLQEFMSPLSADIKTIHIVVLYTHRHHYQSVVQLFRSHRRAHLVVLTE